MDSICCSLLQLKPFPKWDVYSDNHVQIAQSIGLFFCSLLLSSSLFVIFIYICFYDDLLQFNFIQRIFLLLFYSSLFTHKIAWMLALSKLTRLYALAHPNLFSAGGGEQINRVPFALEIVLICHLDAQLSLILTRATTW